VRRAVVAAGVVAVAGVLWAQQPAPPRPVPARWEYRVVDGGVDGQELENRLNALGAEGWEVATAPPTYAGTPAPVNRLYKVILKRQR
jgi:hypothetical protein